MKCFLFVVIFSRDSMEGIMAEHHQQYMRNSSMRLFPDGNGGDMDPTSAAAAAAAAAAMLTEKARSALGLPPSSPAFYNNAGAGQRGRHPGESPFQPFVNPAAAAAMSQLYGRPGAPPPHHPNPTGMIPPPHFWSQFYGLNPHQLGILSNLAGLQHPAAESTGPNTNSPPPPASSPYQSQRFSPYPLNGKPRSTPSPRVSIPSPK